MAAVQGKGDAAGGADPDGVAVRDDRKGAVQKLLTGETVGADAQFSDKGWVAAFAREAVGENLQAVGGGFAGEVDEPGRTAGYERLPGLALVDRADRRAGEKGRIDGLAVEREVETTIENGGAGAALKTRFARIEDKLVGDGGVDQGRDPHRVAASVERADRAATKAMEGGKGDPVRGAEPAAYRRIETGDPAFGADP